VFNFNVKIENIYLKTMENYISTIIRKPWSVTSWRKGKWLNVQNVELTSQSQRRHGKWQVAQTRWEKECNWKSGYMNAQIIIASAKY
jgi:hypothetical protein